MTKHHFVPRFIIKNFSDPKGNIRFLEKFNNQVSVEINHYNQLQKANFYSNKTLSELNELFKHIELNPIFNNPNETLENSLASCLETPMGNITKEISKKFNLKEKIDLTPEEENFIKEYATIQNLRTLKFKAISKEFNNKFLLPSDFGDKIIELELQREPDIKEIVKRNMPNSNRNERRILEIKWKKKLKSNPNLLQEIREKIFEETLENMTKKAEQDIKEVLDHPEIHSADIINLKQRNSFFKRCELHDRAVVVVINLTEIPFVLGDTGIVLMADDPDGRKNLDIFLPIHPRLLIGLSNSLPKNAVIDEAFVIQFNRISKEEAYKNVYSSDGETLKKIV